MTRFLSRDAFPVRSGVQPLGADRFPPGPSSQLQLNFPAAMRVARFTLLAFILLASLAPLAPLAIAADCPPTRFDEIGPFYRPGAPERLLIGKGYILKGTVRAVKGCAPLPGARIEIWQVGPSGQYDDAHRTTLHADASGGYRLETDFPPPYVGRPPHIHLLIDAPGYDRLITQHYPKPGRTEAVFDLVLEPLPPPASGKQGPP